MLRKTLLVLPAMIAVVLVGLVEAQERTPKKYALLIGVNKYDKPGFDELDFAEADVKELAEVLKRDGYTVKLLLGSATGSTHATKANIEAAVKEFVPQCTARDTLIIAVSGHGMELDNKPYYCPVDAVGRDPASMVSLSWLIDEAEKHAGVRLILADACRNDPDPTRGRGIDKESVKLKPNTALFLSCQSNQKALESKDLKHGLFFHCVLQGLRGNLKDAKNDKGEVTPGRLATAVEETFASKFSEWVPNASSKQEPQIANFIPASRVLIASNGLKPGEEREYEIATGVKMKFCWIPPGKATLGAPKTEVGRDSDDLEEREYTSKGFWLGKYEVMQGEWAASGVARKEENSFSAKGDRAAKVAGMDTSIFPAENVSWEECQEFVKSLNTRGKVTQVFGKSGTFCLPHEDEWEYACRGGKGNLQPYYWGKVLTAQDANTSAADLVRTTRVGSYSTAAPHPWGLCDMTGNVWEWCENKYSNDSKSRVLRGGAWRFNPEYCRVAGRDRITPDFRVYYAGFRVCLRLD
jgi:formylglycine-generating enzyme